MIHFGTIRSFVFPICVFFGVVIIGMPFIGHLQQASGDSSELSVEKPKPLHALDEKNMQEMIPSNWRKISFPGKSSGWREMGVAPIGLEETWADVTEIMFAQGYGVRMRIPEGEMVDDVLAEFWDSSKRRRVMWSLRRVKSGETAFSWGIPK